MKRWLLTAVTIGAINAGNGAHAQSAPTENARLIAGCLTAAADVYRLPPAVLVVLLNVEGGSLGHVSANTNATVDIGPMQVNQIWIPQLAAHWHASTADTFVALRDNFCANVEAGAWILRQGLTNQSICSPCSSSSSDCSRPLRNLWAVHRRRRQEGNDHACSAEPSRGLAVA